MVQIPLERTINETYRFAFRNILSIFGIAWFPGLLGVAAGAGAVWFLWPDIANLFFSFPAAKDAAAQAMLQFMLKALAVAGPFFIVIWVLQTMTSVGVQQKALGLIEGPVFIYFSLGGVVWRLIAARIVVFFLVYFGVALMVGAVVAIFWAGTQFHLPAIYGLAEAAAVIAALCAAAYVAVRMTFFLTPVVVAEGGLGIGRAWELGGGNFWRSVALVIVCVVVPLMGIGMVSNFITTPLMMSAMVPLQRAVDAHQIKSLAQVWVMVWPSLKTLLIFMTAYQIVTWPIILGLTNAVSARAYRNVMPPDPLEHL